MINETSQFFIDVISSIPANSEVLFQAPHQEFLDAIEGINYEVDNVFVKLVLKEEYRKQLADLSINDIYEFIQSAKVIQDGAIIFEAYDGFVIGILSKQFKVTGTPLEKHLGKDILFISDEW